MISVDDETRPDDSDDLMPESAPPRRFRLPIVGAAALLLGVGLVLLWWTCFTAPAAAAVVYPGAVLVDGRESGAIYLTQDSPTQVFHWYQRHVPGLDFVSDGEDFQDWQTGDGLEGHIGGLLGVRVGEHALLFGHQLRIKTYMDQRGTGIIINCIPRCKLAQPGAPGVDVR